MTDPPVVLEDTPAPPRDRKDKTVGELLVMEEGPAPRGTTHHGDPSLTAGVKIHRSMNRLVVPQRDGRDGPAVQTEARGTPASGTPKR